MLARIVSAVDQVWLDACTGCRELRALLQGSHGSVSMVICSHLVPMHENGLASVLPLSNWHPNRRTGRTGRAGAGCRSPPPIPWANRALSALLYLSTADPAGRAGRARAAHPPAALAWQCGGGGRGGSGGAAAQPGCRPRTAGPGHMCTGAGGGSSCLLGTHAVNMLFGVLSLACNSWGRTCALGCRVKMRLHVSLQTAAEPPPRPAARGLLGAEQRGGHAWARRHRSAEERGRCAGAWWQAGLQACAQVDTRHACTCLVAL